MAKDVDSRVIFAMVPGTEQPDGIPVLSFLMPEASWTYMKDGRQGHEFDLTKLGLPLRVIIGRCRDHADGMAKIREASRGVELTDARAVDLAFASSAGNA